MSTFCVCQPLLLLLGRDGVRGALVSQVLQRLQVGQQPHPYSSGCALPPAGWGALSAAPRPPEPTVRAQHQRSSGCGCGDLARACSDLT